LTSCDDGERGLTSSSPTIWTASRGASLSFKRCSAGRFPASSSSWPR